MRVTRPGERVRDSQLPFLGGASLARGVCGETGVSAGEGGRTGTFFCVTTTEASPLRRAMVVWPDEVIALNAYSAPFQACKTDQPGVLSDLGQARPEGHAPTWYSRPSGEKTVRYLLPTPRSAVRARGCVARDDPTALSYELRDMVRGVDQGRGGGGWC